MAAQPKPMTPRQREGSLIRYVYFDKFEVHAHSREEAILTLQRYGFINIVESQLVTGASRRPVPVSTDFDRARAEVQKKEG